MDYCFKWTYYDDTYLQGKKDKKEILNGNSLKFKFPHNIK